MMICDMELSPIVGDNAPAINAAIAKLASSYGGGTVFLEPGVYTVEGSILRKSHIFLRGAFNGAHLWDSTVTKGTVIRWTGPAGGAVVRDAPSDDPNMIDGGGISDLTIDGAGTASMGLQSLSSFYAWYTRLHCVGVTGTAYYFGTVDTPLVSQNYRTRVDSLSTVVTGKAHGFILDGVPGSGRNTCFMVATNCTAAFLDGCAYALLNADDNVFIGCSASLIQGGKDGAGLYFGGSSDGTYRAANANQFYGFWTNGYINSAGGSYPSRGNIVYTSSMDGYPLIYQQPGSDLTVISVAGEPGLNGFVRNPLPTG